MQIIARQASSANFKRGRVEVIVLHVEEGTNAGTAATFRDPDAHASAHYGVGSDGAIFQFVGEADVAWHAGNRAVNERSIGIELEGMTATLKLSEAQMSALVELTTALCERYGIRVDRQHIFGHDEVPDPGNPKLTGGASHHTDPGPLFPWDDFMERLGALPVA